LRGRDTPQRRRRAFELDSGGGFAAIGTGDQMVGAGTFLNPLLKIVTVVAVLAASYFFIVKPILDTTEGTIDRAFEESDQIQKSVQQSIKEANQQAQQQGAGNVEFEASGLSPKQAEKIQNCVTQAAGDVNALQACGELANRLSN
jgi:hypothetical protein